MIYRRAIAVNWENVHLERHKSAAASNEKENRSRIAKHYQPGDSVLIVLDPEERHSHPKMSQPTRGPYIITKVNTNGTVEINRGSFNETINIRRLKPFNI
jgi:hypothetical protein